MNVYFASATAVLVVGLVAGAGLKGYSLGKDTVRAEYAARDLAAATAYAAKEREITEANRAKEQKWASSFAQASRKAQREIDKNATYYLTLLATAPVLRDPGSHNPTHRDTGSPTASDTCAHSSGGSILSENTSRLLWSEAARADSVRIRLNSCIDLLEAERANPPSR